jgi:hypothetical protein
MRLSKAGLILKPPPKKTLILTRLVALQPSPQDILKSIASSSQILSQLSESVSPLYIAPPEVCEAAGRTILYGVIPVTSPERSESVEPLPTVLILFKNI